MVSSFIDERLLKELGIKFRELPGIREARG